MGMTLINLAQAKVGTAHVIGKIDTTDTDMKAFLFSLGCYEGEKVTVVSVLAENYVINVKDARYSIDRELAEAILVEE